MEKGKIELLKNAIGKEIKCKINGYSYTRKIHDYIGDILIFECGQWEHDYLIELLEIDGKPISNELDDICQNLYKCNFDEISKRNVLYELIILAKFQVLKQLEAKCNEGKNPLEQNRLYFIAYDKTMNKIYAGTNCDIVSQFNFRSNESRSKFISIVGTDRLNQFLKEYHNFNYIK